MIATTPKITRADHGRRMTLAEFQRAEFEEGLRVELGRGVVEVMEMPHVEATFDIALLTSILGRYAQSHTYVGSAVRTEDRGSHGEPYGKPEITIHLQQSSVPDIVIEIVSDSSRRRDYIDKPIEYWHAEVKEYWIVDPQAKQVQRFTRGAIEWSIDVLRGDHPVTTPLLPNFGFTPNQVFAVPK